MSRGKMRNSTGDAPEQSRYEELYLAWQSIPTCQEHARKQARERFILANNGLVKRLASRYQRLGITSLDFDELVQEGYCGLIYAADHFKYAQGWHGWSSYAGKCIWGYMSQAITRGHGELYISWDAKARFRIIGRGLLEYKTLHDQWPTDEILPARLHTLPTKIAQKLQLEDIEHCRQLLGVDFVSLNAWTGFGGPPPIRLNPLHWALRTIFSPDDQDIDAHERSETVADMTTNPETATWARLLAEEYTSAFEAGVSALPPRNEKVMRLRFGLYPGPPLTLDQIAPYFEVTRERIRQIELKGLRILAQRFRMEVGTLADYMHSLQDIVECAMTLR